MPPDAAALVLPVAEHERGVRAGRGVGVAGPQLVAGAELVRGRRERGVGSGERAGSAPNQPAGVPVRTTQKRRSRLAPLRLGVRHGERAVAVEVGDARGERVRHRAWSAPLCRRRAAASRPARGSTALVEARSPPTLTVITALLPVAGGTTSGHRFGGRVGRAPASGWVEEVALGSVVGRRVGDLRQLGGERRAADGAVASASTESATTWPGHVGVDLDRRGRGEQAAGERAGHDDGRRVDDVPQRCRPGPRRRR